MRAIFALFIIAAAFCIAACANDGPTPQEVQEQLQRGATGQGQLTPEIDRSGDPYVKPRGGRPAGE